MTFKNLFFTKHISLITFSNGFQDHLLFENNANSKNAISKIRDIYERSYKSLKDQLQQYSRALMLEEWKTFELNIPNNEEQIHKLDKKMPRRVKKRRIVDESNDVWEEYYEFEFPEDVQQNSSNKFANLKFLEMAKNWKKVKIKIKEGVKLYE